MSFIKDIYDGEISGVEDFGFNGSAEFRQLQSRKADAINQIEAVLDEDKKKVFGIILETECNIGKIELSRMFGYAFRLGFKAAIDILDKNNLF